MAAKTNRLEVMIYCVDKDILAEFTKQFQKFFLMKTSKIMRNRDDYGWHIMCTIMFKEMNKKVIK